MNDLIIVALERLLSYRAGIPHLICCTHVLGGLKIRLDSCHQVLATNAINFSRGLACCCCSWRVNYHVIIRVNLVRVLRLYLLVLLSCPIKWVIFNKLCIVMVVLSCTLLLSLLWGMPWLWWLWWDDVDRRDFWILEILQLVWRD